MPEEPFFKNFNIASILIVQDFVFCYTFSGKYLKKEVLESQFLS